MGTMGDQSASYDFMSKQLMWNEFGELLNFVVPLLKDSTVNSWIENIFFKQTKEVESTLQKQIESTCLLCHQPPATPYRTNCGHIFCYYCIKSKSMATHNYRCPTCNMIVTEIE